MYVFSIVHYHPQKYLFTFRNWQFSLFKEYKFSLVSIKIIILPPQKHKDVVQKKLTTHKNK